MRTWLGLLLAVASLSVVTGEVPARAGAACAGRPAAGRHTLSVPTSQGTYPVLVYVPTGLAADEAAPMVLNLHGSTQSGSASLDSTELSDAADRHHFVIASPDGGIPAAVPAGLPAGYFWNVPGTPLVKDVPVPPGSRDDDLFLTELVADLKTRLCLDPRRQYVTGASNGGLMASMLGCLHPRLFAALGPVMGVRAGVGKASNHRRIDKATCRPHHPVPVIAIHGVKDSVDAYRGDETRHWGYGVPIAIRRWAHLDHCRAFRRDRTTVSITSLHWSRCHGSSDVVLVRSEVGGHSWPGHPTPPPFSVASSDPTDMSIDANEVLWAFFAAHPRRRTHD